MLGARKRKLQDGRTAAEDSLEGERSPPGEERSSYCSFKKFLMVVLLGLCIFVWAYPNPIDPIPFKYSDHPPPSFEGPLAINDLLKKGEKILENELFGPEALVADHEGNIYTGLGDGRIVRINKDLQTYQVILRTGDDLDVCDSGDISEILEKTCGRPLGMIFRRSNHDELYVADSSLGLLKVNVHTREMEVLVNQSTSPVPFKFLNDLVELPNGTVLMTDSSWKFTRQQNLQESLEGRSNGQLIAYEPRDGSVRVVLKDLFFSNGICLDHSDESVLIAETTRARIKRYYFAGSKEGTVEIFTDNLPIWPDNISPSLSGGYWVGSALIRTPLINFMANQCMFIRSFLAKFNIVWLIEKLVIPHSLVLELDDHGQVVRSFHDKGGHLTTSASHIMEKEGGELLIGSFQARFIVRLKV